MNKPDTFFFCLKVFCEKEKRRSSTRELPPYTYFYVAKYPKKKKKDFFSLSYLIHKEFKKKTNLHPFAVGTFPVFCDVVGNGEV